MTEQLPTLDSAWTGWCRFLQPHDLTDPQSGAHAAVGARLKRINRKFRPEPGPVDAVVYTLFRGVPLLLAAEAWEEPRAGGSSDGATSTDALRGEQWRLVMAFGGFEAVVRAMLTHAEATPLSPRHFEALTAACELPPYRVLQPPTLRDPERDRWFQTGLGARGDLLRRLLGLSDADADAVGRWLAEQQPIASWPASLQLAQALRNATVHGALSASKVREWKLRSPLRTLVDNFGTVTAAVLFKLAKEEPAGATAPRPTGRVPRKRGKSESPSGPKGS